MRSIDDTIVALSSPAGASPCAIVRLSGPQAFALVEDLLALPQPATEITNHPSAISNQFQALPPYTALDAQLRVRPDGPAIPATLYLMRAPRSYTRQHVAEVHTIGSPPLLRMLLDAFVERGARIAEPGEFTRRAFLAGRIDLAQAEAVLAVIQASTAGELRAAALALQGLVSRRVHELHDRLVGLRSLVEASIDFAEHDIELVTPSDVVAGIEDALAIIADALRNADAGALPSEGIRVAFCGLPNAGKSSLFNALLGRPRAIVTPIPGTTRDAVSEPLDIEGIRFHLFDTAGLAPDSKSQIPDPRSSKSQIGDHPLADPIAAEAIARSLGLIAGTHIALVVLDASQPPTGAERELRSTVRAPHEFLLLNKSDLPSVFSEADLLSLPLGPLPLGEGRVRGAGDRRGAHLGVPHPAPLPEGEGVIGAEGEGVVGREGEREVFRTSAVTGEGLDALKLALVRLVRSGRVEASPSDLIWNARHCEALRKAAQALERARQAVGEGMGEELVAADLRGAHDALGAITGRVAPDDLLDRIFAQFCIGK